MALGLRPREGAAIRCAICHDERGSLSACPRCATRFHASCRTKTCPTLGCVAARTTAPAARPWPARRLALLATAWIFGVAAWLPNHPSAVESFFLVLALGYAFFFLARTLLAHASGERGRAWLVHLATLLSSPLWATLLAWLVLLVAPDPYRMRH